MMPRSTGCAVIIGALTFRAKCPDRAGCACKTLVRTRGSQSRSGVRRVLVELLQWNQGVRVIENRSPDPEREKRYAGATYKTYTNREIVSSVCRESPRWMFEFVRVCSTQVTSQPS